MSFGRCLSQKPMPKSALKSKFANLMDSHLHEDKRLKNFFYNGRRFTEKQLTTLAESAFLEMKQVDFTRDTNVQWSSINPTQ
jgi:hypothetical protein